MSAVEFFRSWIPFFYLFFFWVTSGVYYIMKTNTAFFSVSVRLSRVAILEKKLEVLSAALRQQEQDRKKLDSGSITDTSISLSRAPIPLDPPDPSPSNAGSSLPKPNNLHFLGPQNGLVYKNIGNVREKMRKLWKIMSANSAARLANVQKCVRIKSVSYECDAISLGLITPERAEERLELYKRVFNTKHSMVELRDDVTVDEMRRNHPMLFLTVLSLCSIVIEGKDRIEESLTLHNLCMDAIFYETMILGNKTLELLKCLLLINLWFNTPEIHQHQKTHLITHLCTTMAIEMGLGGVNIEPQGSGIRYDRLMRPFLLLNPQTYECRRLWLGVYISSINLSMIMRRPIYLVWSKYTEECCSFLEKHGGVDDLKVASVARINHLHEEITHALQSDDGIHPPNINDPKTRCLIRYFEHKLNEIAGKMDFDILVSETALHVVQIYLHESVMYAPLSKKYGRVPFSEYSLSIGKMDVTIHTTQAIGWCYSSAIKCLEMIAALSVERVSVLPIFCFTRVCVCASTLLKLRTLYLTTPSFSQICKVSSASLEPINTIIKKFEEVIEKYPAAHFAPNFCFVLHVLICHFDRQLYTFFNDPEQQEDTKTALFGALSPRSDDLEIEESQPHQIPQPQSQFQQNPQQHHQQPSEQHFHQQPFQQEQQPELVITETPQLMNFSESTKLFRQQNMNNNNNNNTNNIYPNSTGTFPTSSNSMNSFTPTSIVGNGSAVAAAETIMRQPGSPLDILSSVATGWSHSGPDYGSSASSSCKSSNTNLNGLSGVATPGSRPQTHFYGSHLSVPDVRKQDSGEFGAAVPTTNTMGISSNNDSINSHINNLVNSGPASISASGVAPASIQAATAATINENGNRISTTATPTTAPADPSPENSDLPTWFMTDDFWKDLVPGIEAFSGYELY
jgi:hypothetical protein